MKEIIDKILKGQFEYDEHTLVFSTQRIELNINENSVCEDFFTIQGDRGYAVEGTVSSTEIRMEVMTPVFSGHIEEIGYRFNADGLKEGDVLQGSFRIISNQGEYLLPFVVTIADNNVKSSLGEIRNLFHFANLARSDWDEAVNLFYSPGFIDILEESGEGFKSIYRALSTEKGNQQNLEEFLFSVNKKQHIEYIPDKMEFILEHGQALEGRHIITLTRNGWGYSKLRAVADGDFIILDKKLLTDEDFQNGSCDYTYSIDESKVHGGNNFGSIRFYNEYSSFMVKITIRDGERSLAVTLQMEKRKVTVELMKLYIGFRSRKTSFRSWLTATGRVVAKMTAMDGDDISFQLYNAHYLITAGRQNEGMWILTKKGAEIMKMWQDCPSAYTESIYGYYLYLTTLCNNETSDMSETVGRVEALYRKNPENWRLEWLLQYMSDEYATNPAKKFELLERQFNYSCRSPILYLDTLFLLASNVVILTKLSDFEMCVLGYAARNKLLTAPLIEQTIYIASKEKLYNLQLYNILKACYEAKPGDDILETICSILIKGTRTDREAFEWYRKGVDRQLRLTRLYEYYMMSFYVDGKGNYPCDISKMVLMYFSYHSDLDYEKNAILYKYVYENRENYPELFESYRSQIEQFLCDQIDKGHISRNLGFLYQNMITESMVNESNAAELLKLIYTDELDVDLGALAEAGISISSVVIVYDKCRKEMIYPISGGQAFIPVYGSEYAIVMEESNGNRYSSTIETRLVKLMIPGKISKMCMKFIGSSNNNIDVFLCELAKSAYTITMDNVERYRDIEGSDIIREDCRSEIRDNLISFYYDNDFVRQLTEYLADILPDKLSSEERNDVLETMVMTGMYDKAAEWLKRYGTYGIEPKIIVRLCSRMIDRDNFSGDKKMTEIAFYAFRKGKYDEELLLFLTMNFDGTVREMRDIWKAALSFNIDTWHLCEKMIVQMLYSSSYIGDRMEVFRCYTDAGASTDIEVAFAAECAYENFVKQKVIEEFIFTRIAKLASLKINIPEVCMMDYLKHIADNDPALLNSDTVAQQFLRQLADKRISFAFFQKFIPYYPRLIMLSDKTILEYRAHPGIHCVVHYMSISDEDTNREYCREDMKEMYDGIYVSSFIVFFGEQLQYYITEESGEDTEEQLTESGTLAKTDIYQSDENGRFNLINDIMVASTLQDYKTVDRLLEEYSHNKFLSDHLFRPVRRTAGHEKYKG